MPEKNIYDLPLTRREEIARTASMGPNREHRISSESKKKPNYTLRRRLAATALAAGVALPVASLISSSTEGDERPAGTTVVTAKPGDTIWELQREEAIGSGLQPGADIRDEVDRAVELNGGSDIMPGDKVTLIDIPNKPGSPQDLANK